MLFNWYQNIEALCYSGMCAMMRLIDNHTNLNACTVKCMHLISFAAKSNSDDNPMWDEAMNFPHKQGCCSAREKDINTLNKKQSWEVVDWEDWMKNICSNSDFKKNVTQMEAFTKSKLASAPEVIVKLKEPIYLTPFTR